MRQAEVFLEGEAEAWFARNQNKLGVGEDPVIEAIEGSKLTPISILEVGCSNGWRVKEMEKKWGCKAYGIDPFFKTELWNCRKGTADQLPFEEERFDMVIYGWCLYLCDREDLFKIALEGDRVLRDGGHLVVYDFFTTKPYKKKYKHLNGLFSYKMDHSQLWSSNPMYQLIHRVMYGSGDDKTGVIILRKSLSDGWPLRD